MKKAIQPRYVRAAPCSWRGFTLLELLVVIAIIGVLASLLLSTLSKAKSAALSAKCKSNLRQISIAHMLYTDTYGHFLAYGAQIGPGAPGIVREELGWFWGGRLAPFLNERPSVYINPNFGVAPKPDGNEDERTLVMTNSNTVLVCPAYRGATRCGVGYGYNAYGAPHERLLGGVPAGLGCAGKPVPGVSYVFERRVRESEVKVPSDMIAFGDMGIGSILGKGVHVMEAGALLSRSIEHGHHAKDPTPRFARLHRGRWNLAFVDGHVENHNMAKLFTDMSDAALRRWNRDNEPHREVWERWW